MPNIFNQIDVIRNFINNPRKQHLLISEIANWNKLCSSLDAVGDTELAIQSYLTKTPPPTEGETYITIYGILQILFVQQDAIQHIAESLDIQYSHDPALKEIREIRNDSIGHPTKRGAGKGTKFNFISRPSISLTTFQIVTTYSESVQPKFKDINIPKVIKIQRASVIQILSKIIDKLREEEMKHKKEFQDEKLSDIFPHTLEYYCQKIYESIWGNRPNEFGISMVDLIHQHIAKFKDALDRRDLLQALDSIKYHLDQLDYPLDKLKTYFTNTSDIHFNDKDALIFIFFVREHLKELRDIAKEIDDDYAAES